jgi:hypothetical protein
MIILDKETKDQLIELYYTKNIILEGNILKLIDSSDDEEFNTYLKNCILKDKDTRKKRLEVTKKVQVQNSELLKLNEENLRIMEELQVSLEDYAVQNKELIAWKEDNERISAELKEEMKKAETAMIEAENAKKEALNDLDILQKKSQTELIGKIVTVSLGVIVTIGIITTLMYMLAIYMNKDTQIIGSTWSNMFGILLTNAFSIIGTIMGVKYASKENDSK